MLQTRTLAAAAAAASLIGLALLPAPAQAAAGSVHLYKIYYDSPGSDRGSNVSLNGEYVQIRNTTTKAVSLKGWTLVDAKNHKYVFPTYSLGAGKVVTVHTGQGTNNAAHRYQARKWYVWNNDKDTAWLKRSTGTTADTCSYNSTRVDYRMC
ncbi:lamin tail domain-containing protein [Streptomyces sp. NPDC020681]|uniref:lamin tail domain-containing protein n=1 Tax=Streptomyces sp. NPDC020681 TaxID=3365083 RepID=UPI0037B46C90